MKTATSGRQRKLGKPDGTPTNYVPFDGDTPDLGLPPVNEGQVNAVMTGAGLSKAVCPDSPTWVQLLERVSSRMAPDDMPLASSDLMAYAFRLARGRGYTRSAEPSSFQAAVSEVLAHHWPTNSTPDPTVKDLADRFCDFLISTSCSLILDLNYDPAVETLLTCAGLPFIRVIGSEYRWTDPVDSSAILLWKLHGSIRAPSTIVLSPTEYQFIYEVNSLGRELEKLGSSLDILWTLGVGLRDDDVWSYVCAEKQPKHVVCLWCSSQEKKALEPWEETVCKPDRHITVLHAKPPDGTVGAGFLAERISMVKDTLASLNPPRNRQGGTPRSVISPKFLKAAEEFETRYRQMQEKSRPMTQLALVDEYRDRYQQLKQLLLSQVSSGIGETWCSGLISQRSKSKVDALSDALKPDALKSLAGDFLAVIEVAASWCKQHASVQNGQFLTLVASAAQSAVVHVLDLAGILGIAVETTFGRQPKEAGAALKVGKDSKHIVGCNPFEAPSRAQCNLMHRFDALTDCILQYPIIARSTKPSKGRLMTEDEWEAAVVFLYHWMIPKLTVGDFIVNNQSIMSIPPLYPWGFRFQDIRSYRACGTLLTSKIWSLVGGFDGEGHQYCKGGGLRDRSSRAFEIGTRGLLRIGEYDEFVEAALCAN